MWVPGVSFSASHGWLKNDALTCPPLSSRTIAVTTVRRPRSGRARALAIRPSIATSPSAWPSFAIETCSAALSYRRGAWNSRSRTVSMPKPRSRFASVAPTPGSVDTSSASSRCGGDQPRGRGHSRWTTPVKPGCMRVIVATRTEHRTRSGRHAYFVGVVTVHPRGRTQIVEFSLVPGGVFEPEEADRAWACVGPDDRPEDRRDLDLRVRALVL